MTAVTWHPVPRSDLDPHQQALFDRVAQEARREGADPLDVLDGLPASSSDKAAVRRALPLGESA